jgi:hypothetical protein
VEAVIALLPTARPLHDRVGDVWIAWSSVLRHRFATRGAARSSHGLVASRWRCKRDLFASEPVRAAADAEVRATSSAVLGSDEQEKRAAGVAAQLQRDLKAAVAGARWEGNAARRRDVTGASERLRVPLS